MLTNAVAELITDKISNSKLKLDEKFCFQVVVAPRNRRRATDDEQQSNELTFEVMLTGASDSEGNPEYSLRINDLTLPINVDLRGLKAVILTTFLQTYMVDLVAYDPWYTIQKRQRDDYETTTIPEQRTGLLYRIR